MSRPRPRQALVCGALLAAAAACALPAGASHATSAKAKVVHFVVPLPQTGRGKVVLIEVRSQLPPNMSIGGTIADLTITNLRNLPCYVRAAGITTSTAHGAWRVFVPVDAPKGRVVCQRPPPRSPAKKIALKVQIASAVASHPTTVKLIQGDTCKLMKAQTGGGGTVGVALTGYDLTWRQIKRRTIAADRACK